MPRNHKELGELLIDLGYITRPQLLTALELQGKSGKRLGQILLDERIITPRQLSETLAHQYQIPFIDLSSITVNSELSNLFSPNIARKHNIVPIRVDEEHVYVAMADPLNFIALDEVVTATRKAVVPMLAVPASIESLINQIYGNEFAERAMEEIVTEGDDQKAQAAEEAEIVGGAPVVRLVNSLIEQAVAENASDIHIEPSERDVRIRMRIDGRLQTVLNAPLSISSALSARVKIIGGMDIAEKRIPQDGRYEAFVKGRDIDLRISSLPTLYGEKIVMRVLDRSGNILTKEKIGLSGKNLERFDDLLRNPHGIILITGPTGSGKSSTLYTMHSQLNNEHDNIITLENPVEYTLAGINQVQVNEKAGLTFAAGLRSILRQDPDIIMVGEIRDAETAQIAVRAAITGHLVLSTLHTNSATGAISRLEDMEVETYMISDSLKGVIAQRLVRRICQNCKAEYTPTDEDFRLLGMQRTKDKEKFFKGKGCSVCGNTGYKGRIAVFEILSVDRAVRDLIYEHESVEKISQAARAGGMTSIKEECIRLVREGVTTFDEAIFVSFSQEG